MMSEYRLRILVHDYAGHPFQVQLSRTLARRGHTVCHAWCARLQTPRGALERRKDDAPGLGFAPVDLGQDFAKYGLWSRWRQEKHYGRLLGNLVREFRPDVVLSGNTPLRAQAKLLRATRQDGASFIYWVQDVLGVGIGQALGRRLGPAGVLAGRVLAAMERRLWAKSDHVVVISEDFLPYLPPRVREDRTSVIENWAPLEDVPRGDRDTEWAREHGLQDSRIVLYTGTLGLKHNPLLLADLAERLKETPDARIVVVSEGPGADYLRSQDLPNLIVLPFQPFERMPEMLASADVLVALLEKEAGEFAVPSKVLTYLCAGRPLLLAVPERNLARRIVQFAQAGLTVDPDDGSGFLDSAVQLLQDGELRGRLGDNARAYAEQTFDIGRITDRFESILGFSGAARAAALASREK